MRRYGLHDVHTLYLELVSDLVVCELDRAGIRSGRLLDLGCGRGVLSSLLAQSCSLTVVGLDFLRECLQDAVAIDGMDSRQNARPRFVLGDAYRAPFADGSFDVIVSTGLSSAGSYFGMQRELERLLRPGGLAIVDYVRLPTLWRPWTSLWRFRQWRRETDAVRKGAEWDGKLLKHYQYGGLGIREHFEVGTSLRVVRYHRLRTWHQLLPGVRAKRLFERTLGRAFSPVLAGALLVVLRKDTRHAL